MKAEGKAASTSASEAHLGEVGLKDGKSARSKRPTQPPIHCPECGSTQVWKDGLRYTKHGEVQRWLCRSCGFRFSESTELKVKVNVAGKGLELLDPSSNLAEKMVRNRDFPIQKPMYSLPFLSREDVGSHKSHLIITDIGKGINTHRHYNSKCRVSASEREAKNLAETQGTRQKWAAGATTTKPVEADIKGKIIEFAWWMKKEGYAESTIKVNSTVIRVLAERGVNLFNQDSVKETIAKQKWSEARRHTAIAAYTLFLKMIGQTWTPPICKVTRKLPFIPTEEEIDALIAGCGPKTSTFLQLLKETGMRAGEANRLAWTDIDMERRTITLNSPEKSGNPRMFKVSSKLIAMLNALPKTSVRVFGDSPTGYKKSSFYLARKRLARKLQNPRLLRISFHTLRHWKATMLYHETKDILYVKEFLGHKKVETTLLYIQLAEAIFKETTDEFTVRVASQAEEITKLLEVGFEYICEKDGLLYFRKRK